MADNYPVPPPPPPQGHKPVPPPPPRQASPAPMAPAQFSGEAFAAPMIAKNVAAPTMPVQTPKAAPQPGPKPAAMPSMPGMPGMGPSPLEQRLQEMEKRFQDQESAKISLESQLADIGKQLKEEHEKVILQSLKAKEEEALSARVEQQIREMQEKLRRDKHEQDLHESRSKAENQLKDLERRLAEERESWMSALKNQLKERELIEQDVEQNLSRKLREVEQRYQDEKIQWVALSRQKDEELSLLRRQEQQEIERLKEALEEKVELIEEVRETAVEQRRAFERESLAEQRTLQTQLDGQMRDNGTLKAQLALLQTQLQQGESQRQEERARAQAQFNRLEQDHLEMRKRLESQMSQREEESKRQADDERRRLELQATSREEELKRDFARRDQERTQYWEGIVTQTRSEKEVIKNSLIGREEEISRLSVEVAELRRTLDVDRNRWPAEIEKIRKTAHDEAAASIPELVHARIAAKRQKWETQTHADIHQAKTQLARAVESQKALSAKLNVEAKRAAQEIQTLQSQVQALTEEREAIAKSLGEEKTLRETQTKQFLQRLAETQLRESALREELGGQTKQWQGVLQEWKNKLEVQDHEFEAAMTAREQEWQATLAAKEQEWQQKIETQAQEWNDNLGAKQRDVAAQAEAQHHILAEMEALQNQKQSLETGKNQAEHELHNLRLEIKAMAQAQLEWKNTIAHLQEERNQRELEWAGKEKEWLTTKATLEKTFAELQKAKAAPAPTSLNLPVAAAGPINPEAVKALASIKQQMQEMQTLLAWLKPLKKPQSLGKAA